MDKKWAVLVVSATAVTACSQDSRSGATSTAPVTAVTYATGAQVVAPREQSSPCAAAAPVDQHTGITVWETFGGQEGPNVFTTLLDEYDTTQRNVSVSVESLDGSVALWRRLQETPVEQWPDVIAVSHQGLKRLNDTGRLVPPSACAGIVDYSDTMLPAVESAYSYGGVLRGVPYGISTPALWYDRNRFENAGLDPNRPPQTLADVAEVSQTVVDTGASPHGLVIYDWYGHYLLLNSALARGELFATPGNGRNAPADRVELNTEANRVLGAWLLDMLDTRGAVWIGVTPSGIEDLMRAGDRQDGAAMTFHTTGSLGDVLAALDTGSFPHLDLDVAPLPGTPGGSYLGGIGLWVLDRGDAQQVRAASLFVEWMTRPEQLGRFIVATGYAPAWPAVADTPLVELAWTQRPVLRVGYDHLVGMAGGDVSAGPLFGPSSEIDSLLFQFTTAVVERRVSVEAGLDKLTDDINTILAQYDAAVEANPPP